MLQMPRFWNFAADWWPDSAHPRRCAVLESSVEKCLTRTKHSGSPSTSFAEASYMLAAIFSLSDLSKICSHQLFSIWTAFNGLCCWNFLCCISPVSSPGMGWQTFQGAQSFMFWGLFWSPEESHNETKVTTKMELIQPLLYDQGRSTRPE